MRGRPEIFNQEHIIKALQKSHGVKTEAARILGCSRPTIDRYIDKYPAVKEVYDEQNEILLDEAEAYLGDFMRGDIEGQTPQDRFSAIRFYLRTKGRKRGYGDRMDLNNEGASIIPIQVNVINKHNDK